MGLTSKWWITPMGSFELGGLEHEQFAIAQMLAPPGEISQAYVPKRWMLKGIPGEELGAALARGADPQAVQYLSVTGRADTRLFVIRELGWIRTVKNQFDMWVFDESHAELIRNSQDYWNAQTGMHDNEMLDVYELSTQARFSISLAKLLDGGDPAVLKSLTYSNLEADQTQEAPVQTSLFTPGRTVTFGELERKRLVGITGDNPPREEHVMAEHRQFFPTLHAGPVEMYTKTGKKIKWVPTTDLVLITNEPEVAQARGLPERIAMNPRHTLAELSRQMDEGPQSVEQGHLIIGFNVGDAPFWRAGEIFLLTLILRENQLRESGLGTGFSFWTGLGMYAPQKEQATVEESAHVVIGNLSDPPQPKREFKQQMLALAKQLADYLSQDSVYLEVSDGGVTVFHRYVPSDEAQVETPEVIKELLEQNKHRISADKWEM